MKIEIPERQLSYGELLERLHKAYRLSEERKKRLMKLNRRKKAKTDSVPTYSYQDIVNKIDELNQSYRSGSR